MVIWQGGTAACYIKLCLLWQHLYYGAEGVHAVCGRWGGKPQLRGWRRSISCASDAVGWQHLLADVVGPCEDVAVLAVHCHLPGAKLHGGRGFEQGGCMGEAGGTAAQTKHEKRGYLLYSKIHWMVWSLQPPTCSRAGPCACSTSAICGAPMMMSRTSTSLYSFCKAYRAKASARRGRATIVGSTNSALGLRRVCGWGDGRIIHRQNRVQQFRSALMDQSKGRASPSQPPRAPLISLVAPAQQRHQLLWCADFICMQSFPHNLFHADWKQMVNGTWTGRRVLG